VTALFLVPWAITTCAVVMWVALVMQAVAGGGWSWQIGPAWPGRMIAQIELRRTRPAIRPGGMVVSPPLFAMTDQAAEFLASPASVVGGRARRAAPGRPAGWPLASGRPGVPVSRVVGAHVGQRPDSGGGSGALRPWILTYQLRDAAGMVIAEGEIGPIDYDQRARLEFGPCDIKLSA
jgi:hypothetical protein